MAVKIQYPGALQTMTLDLVNLRSVSAFLQKTELQFDLVSAVDELQKQIHLEFEFMRCAGLGGWQQVLWQRTGHSRCVLHSGMGLWGTAIWEVVVVREGGGARCAV